MDDNWNGRVHTYPKWFQLAPERKCVSWGPWSGLNTLKNDKMLFTSGKSKNALCPSVVSVVLININIIILWKENLDYIIFCLSMVTFYLEVVPFQSLTAVVFSTGHKTASRANNRFSKSKTTRSEVYKPSKRRGDATKISYSQPSSHDRQQ